MELGAGKLEEVKGDAANVGRVRLSNAVLTTVGSLDMFSFYRFSGKPLEGLKQGSDWICQTIPPKSRHFCSHN